VEHSEELEGALDYLMNIEGGRGIFQASASVLDKKEHLYREEREVVLYVFWIILQCVGMSLSERIVCGKFVHISVRSYVHTAVRL